MGQARFASIIIFEIHNESIQGSGRDVRQVRVGASSLLDFGRVIALHLDHPIWGGQQCLYEKIKNSPVAGAWTRANGLGGSAGSDVFIATKFSSANGERAGPGCAGIHECERRYGLSTSAGDPQ